MIEFLARLGYASKAVIYVIVGGLAAAAALHRGGRITDTSGVLRVILTQPYGNAILLVLSLGLCGYAVWRLLDAIFDPDRHGVSPAGLAVRTGRVLRGAVYAMFGFEAFRLARGLRGSGGREAELWTARIMNVPFGDWAVAIAGAGVMAYGVAQIVRAVREKRERSLDLSSLPASWRSILLDISRFGVAARAVIIVVLGTFLIRAGLRHNPSEVAGTRESMLELARLLDGRWVLTVVAIGLIAYGVNQALHARYRRIRSPI